MGSNEYQHSHSKTHAQRTVVYSECSIQVLTYYSYVHQSIEWRNLWKIRCITSKWQTITSKAPCMHKKNQIVECSVTNIHAFKHFTNFTQKTPSNWMRMKRNGRLRRNICISTKYQMCQKRLRIATQLISIKRRRIHKQIRYANKWWLI